MDSNRQFSYNGDSPSHHEDTDEHISGEQLRRLVQLLDQSDVSEIELKRLETGTRLVLRKAKAPQSNNQDGQQLMVPMTAAQPIVENSVPDKTQHSVQAPLVGIFHPWAKPKGGTLVAVGDYVKVGQLVATIQSLNVINEVESPVAGRVVEILVQDGQAVEYGQQLMSIDSKEGA